MITATTNEEAVRTDHRDCHPNPHIIHHLRILPIPLASQVGGQPLLRIPSLAAVAAGGRGASVVGVDESGAMAPAAFRTRRLTLENILGSRSTRQGESAVPHRCLHSSATSSCRICTSPPVLHDRACSTDILAPQPSQAAGISSGEWLYRRRTLSLHSSADRPVPFNRFGKTESHAPAAQFSLSRLATAGLSRPRRSRKICSSWSRSL